MPWLYMRRLGGEQALWFSCRAEEVTRCHESSQPSSRLFVRFTPVRWRLLRLFFMPAAYIIMPLSFLPSPDTYCFHYIWIGSRRYDITVASWPFPFMFIGHTHITYIRWIWEMILWPCQHVTHGCHAFITAAIAAATCCCHEGCCCCLCKAWCCCHTHMSHMLMLEDTCRCHFSGICYTTYFHACLHYDGYTYMPCHVAVTVPWRGCCGALPYFVARRRVVAMLCAICYAMRARQQRGAIYSALLARAIERSDEQRRARAAAALLVAMRQQHMRMRREEGAIWRYAQALAIYYIYARRMAAALCCCWLWSRTDARRTECRSWSRPNDPTDPKQALRKAASIEMQPLLMEDSFGNGAGIVLWCVVFSVFR